MNDLKRMKFVYVCGIIAALCFAIVAFMGAKEGDIAKAIFNGITATLWMIISIINRRKYNNQLEEDNKEN